MPQWIHDRAKHIRAKNPDMSESTSFAIATQQSHSLGKSPKGYGTTEGRQTANEKYDTPRDDKKTADPGGIGKEAGLFRAIAPIATQEQDDRMRQIIREELRSHSSGPSVPTPPKQPSIKAKTAALSPALLEGFSDEITKIAQVSISAPKPTVSSQVTGRLPSTAMRATTPRYSQANPATPASGQAQSHQPVLSPPPVRG